MNANFENISSRFKWWLAATAVEIRMARLARLLDRKYDPNQPRLPAGQPDGGQWTGDTSATHELIGVRPISSQSTVHDSGDAADVSVGSILNAAKILAASRASMNKCIALCYPLLERFQPPGSNLNEFDFRKCLNACLGLN
jgi:hypothetical protein